MSRIDAAHCGADTQRANQDTVQIWLPLRRSDGWIKARVTKLNLIILRGMVVKIALLHTRVRRAA